MKINSLTKVAVASFLLAAACVFTSASANTTPGTGQDNPPPPFKEETPQTPYAGAAGSWTLVVLPDTQNLVQKLPKAFNRQLDWIVAHQDSHNIRMVLHEGDITHYNTDKEWRVARKGFQKLIDAKIPFAVLPGNHDYGERGKSNERVTPMSEHFKPTDYANSEAFGLFEENRMENSWHQFTSPNGNPYLVVALEFGPRDEVLQWANEVIAAHPEHRVIVLTHAYLARSGQRQDYAKHLAKYGRGESGNPKNYPFGKAGNTNDGEDIWQKLASNHKNILFVLCGHTGGKGVGYLVDKGKNGNNVHQILANYQAIVEPRRPWQGGAYLRLMQFSPDEKTVEIKTYSPWTDDWLTEDSQQFSIELD